VRLEHLGDRAPAVIAGYEQRATHHDWGVAMALGYDGKL
jgi:hypothetical protein